MLFFFSWPELRKKYEGGFLLSRLLSIPADYASEARAVEVEQFFAANPVPGAERTVKQVMCMRMCVCTCVLVHVCVHVCSALSEPLSR